MKTRHQQLLALAALFAIYVIWGTTYLAGAFALNGFPPLLISAFRYLAAGTILALWILCRREDWPARKHWKILVLSGILMLSGGSGLVIVGEQYIGSGAAAVIMATEPLCFVLLDRPRWPMYFSDKRMIVGLLTGFTGIALFAYFSPPGHPPVESRPFLGTVITLLSAVFWVVGALYANRQLPAKSSTLANSSLQLLAAGLFSGLVALFSGEWPALHIAAVPMRAWAGLSYLVIMGSLAAYLSFNWLITVKPPAIVSTHTYVNPVIALLAGWLLAGEPLSAPQLLALIPVLAGVLLTQLSKQRQAIPS